MKSRYSTIKQDEKIMALYLDGKTPKEIVFLLSENGLFISVWVVYRAVKRFTEQIVVDDVEVMGGGTMPDHDKEIRGQDLMRQIP